jgi:fatty-acid peroxygenase
METARLVPIPYDDRFDSTLALLSEGYRFISGRCTRHNSDAFHTRIMLRRVTCAMGEDAARMFYEPERFTRRGSTPLITLLLLQDKGSVQGLDGAMHRCRKQVFLSLMSPGSIARLVDLTAEEWAAGINRWQAMREIRLFPEAEEVLCRAVCRWSGVPLAETEATRRSRELSAMIEGSGSIGPRSWKGLLLRARTERWVRGLVEQVRAGRLEVPGDAALSVVARHRDLDGSVLDTKSAGVELINVLRPVVAVARFITFAALALYEHPKWAETFATGNDADAEHFAQEVRRFYPFFPAVGGRVTREFEWRGHTFRKGAWVLFDLYGTNHDKRIWDEPDTFRPERFRDWDGSAYDFVPPLSR